MRLELLTKIFWSQKENPNFGFRRNGNEVHGLIGKVEPENCKIVDDFNGGNQHYYLLGIDDYLVLMRVCDASAYCDCDYEKFAFVHCLTKDNVQKNSIIEKFSRWKNANTRS